MTFWILAPLMVLAAHGIMFVRKAVHAAMLLSVFKSSIAILYSVMEAIRTEHHERQAPARVLARIRKAKEMLSDLQPDDLNDKQRRRLRSDLAALQAQASYLLGEGERPREDGLIDKIYRKLRA